MIKIFDLIGRVFISGVFLLSGFNKIGNYDGTILDGKFWRFFINTCNVLEIVAPILIKLVIKQKLLAALSLF